ncbi:aminopeptidase P family protein [Cognatiyoonia sp. IB215446]|uniref:aminopeptidase P family protein n=1 Tax=Cognatiyoonia sp. IB215446 TaxID=3097355 RepID=UPI002A144CBF|nr:aminopeptidase P family protein [Cognatiyoonia sp. IB215446]MDX8348128.1 aminopeptidase P family protein [Cognatiyoonia sp. IB215446]
MIDKGLLERLAPYASPSLTGDLTSVLDRVSVVPGAKWRPEWCDVVFSDLPDPLRTEILANIGAVEIPEIKRDQRRVGALRQGFEDRGIDAVIVPQRNDHGSRDMPFYARRLEWLTGFSGSAGTAVIAKDAAWLFVDGRYVVQADQELEGTSVVPRHHLKPPMWVFLKDALPEASRVGFDPKLHSPSEIETAKRDSGHVLVPLDEHPIDTLWPESDRAARPFGAVVPHPIQYTGRTSDDKRAELGRSLAAAGVDSLVVTELEAIAWTFNIRGGDTETTPVPEAYAVFHADGHADLFIERAKLSSAVEQQLGNSVTIQDYNGFGDALDQLASAGRSVGYDRNRVSAWVADRLSDDDSKPVHLDDPILQMREVKTEAERNGFHEALARDGAAVVKFLHWLSELDPAALPDEYTLAQTITAFRAEDPTFRGVSFSPIVGSGPNAAIIHYSPPKTGSRRLAIGEPVLIDSGGQYLSGTTDITRTIAVGPPPADVVRLSTAVLRGHIALATARFPEGTTGAQLDGIARAPVWAEGVQFDHGTGHGIGSFLAVHEGRVVIAQSGSRPIQAGNVLSNEPGAYLRDAFGIRHENTMIAYADINGLDDVPFLRFETVTAAPFDTALIDTAILSAQERLWLNNYHQYVVKTVEPYLEGAAMDWLLATTQPV